MRRSWAYSARVWLYHGDSWMSEPNPNVGKATDWYQKQIPMSEKQLISTKIYTHPRSPLIHSFFCQYCYLRESNMRGGKLLCWYRCLQWNPNEWICLLQLSWHTICWVWPSSFRMTWFLCQIEHVLLHLNFKWHEVMRSQIPKKFDCSQTILWADPRWLADTSWCIFRIMVVPEGVLHWPMR
jgi:hypothetical protein